MFRTCIVLCILFISLGGVDLAMASSLSESRPYDPIVLRGGKISPMMGVPCSELFVYSYDSASGTWDMIPFQIDERVLLDVEDLDHRHYYAQTNTNPDYVFQDTDPSLDAYDELVFLIQDLGDRAPDDSWIENTEARSHDRLELAFHDPLDPERTGYAYLYRSPTLTMPREVKNRYGLAFDPQNHEISSNGYSIRISTETGLIEDIRLHPPFGTGVDFFDTQKLRINAYMELGPSLTIALGQDGVVPSGNETFLYVYPNSVYCSYTDTPVVRVVREVRMTLRIGGVTIPYTRFFVKAFFYPHMGTVSGGASLDPEDLKEELNTNEEIIVELDYLRQSWDLNANATGMTVSNAFNSELRVDGQRDEYDDSVALPEDGPLEEWTLATGDQGTLFTWSSFVETGWDHINFYYHDDDQRYQYNDTGYSYTSGSQADSEWVIGSDTGDKISYGDYGLAFRGRPANSAVDLSLDFTAYFLDKNQTTERAEQLASHLSQPVTMESRLVTDVKKQPQARPREYRLLPGFPNPFNQSTRIRFQLPVQSRVTIQILDINGRNIATITDRRFAAGSHQVRWNGRNSTGREVASGLYIVQMISERYTAHHKVMLVK